MTKNRLCLLIPAFVAVASAAGIAASPIAAPQGAAGIGRVHSHFKHFEKSGNDIMLTGGFSIEAPDSGYSFSADKLTGVLWTGMPRNAYYLDHAVAKGNSHDQVKATIVSITEGYSNNISADTMTYACDSTFATDGTLTFTGHVKMETRDPLALAEPGNSTFGKLTVTLGKGKDYPKIEGEDGDATFVPNQGSK